MTTLALAPHRLRQFLALTKPRVVSLIVFTAVIGMFLASPGIPPAQAVLFGTVGIALVAGAAAAINCLVEQKIDAVMRRTRGRPLPRGEITSLQTLVFACVVGALGLWLLFRFVNPLTMGLNGVAPEALLLFLIIFIWTPPHFWSLALYRRDDYARARLPMLPVTHGPRYTQLQIVLYTLVLFAVSLLPYAVRMSGVPYLVAAIALGAAFVYHALKLYRGYSDALARATFRFSIFYLAALFSALLLDHYWR
jgi:protoheme IX farnesyltransferase